MDSGGTSQQQHRRSLNTLLFLHLFLDIPASLTSWVRCCFAPLLSGGARADDSSVPLTPYAYCCHQMSYVLICRKARSMSLSSLLEPYYSLHQVVTRGRRVRTPQTHSRAPRFQTPRFGCLRVWSASSSTRSALGLNIREKQIRTDLHDNTKVFETSEDNPLSVSPDCGYFKGSAKGLNGHHQLQRS